MSNFSLTKAAFTTGDYYKSINKALKSINGNYHMLHYPFYKDSKDSFRQAQNNLIEHCLGKLSGLAGKDVLDVGCGNGMVALYMAENFDVKSVTGIDLNANNIKIANDQGIKRNKNNVEFHVGNAQDLSGIKSNSIDIVINIESAFHYPQKKLFIEEINRVLKPGGQFIIADILTTAKENAWLKNWKKKMKFHHWPLSAYQEAFKKHNLALYADDDITHQVILGFQQYKTYFKMFHKNGFIRDMLLKLFFIINVKLNVRLLKKKRRYYIFSGEKQA